MISNDIFIRQSLETHLFFSRIMKEHSLFLQLGFTPGDPEYVSKANKLRMDFDKFLLDVVNISNGNISNELIEAQEIVTPYTIEAEEKSIFYTGVIIPINITRKELRLNGGNYISCDERLEKMVCALNERAIDLINCIIEFKIDILNNVTSCYMFTLNYPLLIDHILREAKLYLSIIHKLQNREHIFLDKEIYEQELFWNRIMAEHSMFIRGLLDPTENNLINAANDFANEFQGLNKAVLEAMDKSIPVDEVTDSILEATRNISAFNAQATEGLLCCEIMSVILPLLGDHVLRESNHFLRLLKMFKESE